VKLLTSLAVLFSSEFELENYPLLRCVIELHTFARCLFFDEFIIILFTGCEKGL